MALTSHIICQNCCPLEGLRVKLSIIYTCSLYCLSVIIVMFLDITTLCLLAELCISALSTQQCALFKLHFSGWPFLRHFNTMLVLIEWHCRKRFYIIQKPYLFINYSHTCTEEKRGSLHHPQIDRPCQLFSPICWVFLQETYWQPWPVKPVLPPPTLLPGDKRTSKLALWSGGIITSCCLPVFHFDVWGIIKNGGQPSTLWIQALVLAVEIFEL